MGYKKTVSKSYRRQVLLPALIPQTKPRQFTHGNQAVKNAIKKAQAKAKPPAPAVKTVKSPPVVNPPAANLDVGVLHRDNLGWYARFSSKSNPGVRYVTRKWEVSQSRFKPGDISCNCPGYIYNHKCHHTDDLIELHDQWKNAGPSRGAC